ncbi:MAG: hypothetical protein GY821_17980 [Gammaproteobacteria bacterium]|nr:hypothetical protein [Gammaproteobacteria bacterium]
MIRKDNQQDNSVEQNLDQSGLMMGTWAPVFNSTSINNANKSAPSIKDKLLAEQQLAKQQKNYGNVPQPKPPNSPGGCCIIL